MGSRRKGEWHDLENEGEEITSQQAQKWSKGMADGREHVRAGRRCPAHPHWLGLILRASQLANILRRWRGGNCDIGESVS